MHFDNGEFVPDHHDPKDLQLYTTALHWGTEPTPMGPTAKMYAARDDDTIGSHQVLVSAMPAGYFDGLMSGSEAIIRGCVKLAASNSELRDAALAHVALYGSPFIAPSADTAPAA